MEKKKSRWIELECNHLNNEGFWIVNACETDDNCDEGKIIAAIDNDTSNVFYVDNEARTYSYAQEVINNKISEINKVREEEIVERMIDSVSV